MPRPKLTPINSKEEFMEHMDRKRENDDGGIYLTGANGASWDLFKEIRDKAESGSEIEALAQRGLDYLKGEAI